MGAFNEGLDFEAFFGRADFKVSIKTTAGLADQGLLAGFVVTQGLDAEFPGIWPVKEAGRIGEAEAAWLIPDEAQGRLRMLVSGRRSYLGANPERLILPLASELTAHQTLQEGNPPGLIRMTVASRFLGGAVAGAWRASSVREYDPTSLSSLASASSLGEAQRIIRAAGFNWLTIDFSDGQNPPGVDIHAFLTE